MKLKQQTAGQQSDLKQKSFHFVSMTVVDCFKNKELIHVQFRQFTNNIFSVTLVQSAQFYNIYG